VGAIPDPRAATIPPNTRSTVEDSTNGRRRSTSTTLRDVAEASGVSVTTASRILNGRATGVPIRDDTRQRVLTAAADLGYKPNLLARGLRGSRSSLIGVIARDISDPFHIQVLQGVNEITRAREYRLFLGHVDYQPDVALSYGSMFERSHADGIMVLGDLADGAPFTDLASQHRFVVGVSDRVGPASFPGVYSDSVEGTRLALEHLRGLGHSRITCVSDPGTADQLLRADIYERWMAEQGYSDQLALFRIRQPDPEPAYRLGLELFDDSRGELPTAIYATSDTIAIGLLRAAYQAGVVVPDQLSIVGFDNIAIAAYTIPPLTTVDQAGVEMGRIAASLLLDMIETDRSGDDVEDVVITPTLIVRDSTAAPAATPART
jgi:DNA-binding LacI/PurR family transcriptional regulator